MHIPEVEKDEAFDFGKLDLNEFKDLPKSFNVKVTFLQYSILPFFPLSNELVVCCRQLHYSLRLCHIHIVLFLLGNGRRNFGCAA